jgi:uncharacterized protein GlcG (DUF336 family)
MINLKDARHVIAAAEARAHEIGQPVVEAGGNLVSHVRMDGAWIGSIDISINKAFTARIRHLDCAALAVQRLLIWDLRSDGCQRTNRTRT